jgi:hypothetical protein
LLDCPKVLFVGDNHVGSVHAQMPRDCVTLEGNKILPGPRQAFIMDLWDKFMEWVVYVKGNDRMAVVFMGDHMEGAHHGTKEIWSPDPSDHTAMAERLLAPLADLCEKRAMLFGTECHTHNAEAKLAWALGCAPDPHTGKTAWEELDLNIEGHGKFRCTHHIGTSSREWTASTPPTAALSQARLACVDADHTPPKSMAAGHRHRMDLIRTPGGGISFSTPSWQGLTRHGRKVVTHSRSGVGSIIMDFTDVHNPRPWYFHRFAKENPGLDL